MKEKECTNVFDLFYDNKVNKDNYRKNKRHSYERKNKKECSNVFDVFYDKKDNHEKENKHANAFDVFYYK